MSATKQSSASNARIALAAVLLALLLPGLGKAEHALGGSVALGWSSGSCDTSPNCIAWFRVGQGCDAASAAQMRTNMVSTSITSVSHIANSTGHVIRIQGTALSGVSGAVVEYFNSACQRTATLPAIDIGASRSIGVPAGAKWMTVTGRAVAQMTWTMT